MGKSYALPKPILKAVEVVDAKVISAIADIRKSEDYMLYEIPWGEKAGQITVKTAVEWKAKKGVDFAKVAVKHGKLLDAIEQAIDISKAFRNVTGRTIYRGYPYPKKAIAQKHWRKIKALVDKYKERKLFEVPRAKYTEAVEPKPVPELPEEIKKILEQVK